MQDGFDLLVAAAQVAGGISVLYVFIVSEASRQGGEQCFSNGIGRDAGSEFMQLVL